MRKPVLLSCVVGPLIGGSLCSSVVNFRSQDLLRAILAGPIRALSPTVLVVSYLLGLIPAAVTGLTFGLIADHISDQPANFVIPTYTDRRKHAWNRPSDQHSPDFLRNL